MSWPLILGGAMSDVSPEHSRDFYRAAAHFYRKAPWRSIGEREIIGIHCSQLEGGPWFAVVLGKKSRLRGLILFDDLEGCRLMAEADS